jgi:hypothetical protein
MKRIVIVLNKIRNYITKNKVIKIRLSITWWDILITILLIYSCYDFSLLSKERQFEIISNVL